jgi:hypothetical protein
MLDELQAFLLHSRTITELIDEVNVRAQRNYFLCINDVQYVYITLTADKKVKLLKIFLEEGKIEHYIVEA